MRVPLRGINSATKRLADGRIVAYWYAWRGGPRLRGEPGTPEFIASYNEAVARKVRTPTGVMLELLRYFESTTEFTGLAERTQADYRKKITLIERRFGDLPLAALGDPRTRGDFKEWRDELAKKSPRQADYAWVVLARVLAVAKDRGKIRVNPCEKGGRLYDGSRRDKIWSYEDEDAFLAKAPEHMHLPFLLAINTAQRQGDLLRLPWSGYDGQRIRLRQSKTGVRVAPPVGARLKAALDAAAMRKTGPLILTTMEGRPWTEDGFRSSWRKARAKAGVSGLTFHDLRGTAVTRLALAGATEPEIAVFSGLPLSEVRDILERHYLHRDPTLGDSALKKLETRTESANRTTNRATGSGSESEKSK